MRIFAVDDQIHLVALHRKDRVRCLGRAEIYVTKGTVSCMGHQLSSFPLRFHAFYSPSFAILPPLVVESNANCANAWFSDDIHHLLAASDVERMKMALNGVDASAVDALLIVRSLEGDGFSEFASLYRPMFNSFFPSHFDDLKHSPRSIFNGTCCFADELDIAKATSGHLLHINEHWQQVGYVLRQQPEITTGTRLPVICAVGGRNSNKSTFSRFVTNCLLNQYPSVMYLDCDPGQCEFTPPGFVSLTRVDRPLFGPTLTHFQAPEL
jgi:hypothetical protein